MTFRPFFVENLTQFVKFKQFQNKITPVECKLCTTLHCFPKQFTQLRWRRYGNIFLFNLFSSFSFSSADECYPSFNVFLLFHVPHINIFSFSKDFLLLLSHCTRKWPLVSDLECKKKMDFRRPKLTKKPHFVANYPQKW